MFGFKKNKKISAPQNYDSKIEGRLEAPKAEGGKGFFVKLKQGLQKTRANFTQGLGDLLYGRKQIDAKLLDDIEVLLLQADVGSLITKEIIANLTNKLARKELDNGEAVFCALQEQLENILAPVGHSLSIDKKYQPEVILMVGVNGAGKTTTIGKIAKWYQHQNKQVMLAAGDTFRAAAIEQLQVWGERNKIPVVAQSKGSDSASVIFDALQSAQAKKTDILLADTAGRLHTQDNLMQELKKVKKVMRKLDTQAPHEVLLVIDATIGQNALEQAKRFHEEIGLTGLVITKLDGTAKGGMIFAIAKSLGLPIQFIGVGEGINDLRPFLAKEYVKALLEK